MIDFKNNSIKSTATSVPMVIPDELSGKLPGYISFEKKPYGVYGRYFKNTYTKDGKVYHENEWLGKVINPKLGLFFSRARGYFTFSLENGYGEASAYLGNPL
jgi:hypothetical protein